MFKIYQKYIIKKYFKNFILVTLVFFSLAIILNIFEEISFFKNVKANPLIPYFLTFLNAPITLFEIFPFIFLISTQFFFYRIFKNDEITVLEFMQYFASLHGNTRQKPYYKILPNDNMLNEPLFFNALIRRIPIIDRDDPSNSYEKNYVPTPK